MASEAESKHVCHPPPSTKRQATTPTPLVQPRPPTPPVGSTDPVEVVEGGPELVELLLADAFGVSRQDLVLDLVDGASDGGEELLPAHADVLGGAGAG